MHVLKSCSSRGLDIGYGVLSLFIYIANRHRLVSSLRKKSNINRCALDFLGMHRRAFLFFYLSCTLFFPLQSCQQSTSYLLRKVLRESPRSTVALGRGKVICIIHQSKKRRSYSAGVPGSKDRHRQRWRARTKKNKSRTARAIYTFSPRSRFPGGFARIVGIHGDILLGL